MTRSQTRPKSRGSVGFLSLFSLLIIVAISVALALVLSQFLREALLQRDAAITQELVQSIAYSQNAVDYFSARDAVSNASPLENFFNQIIYLPDVVKAHAFSTDGSVLWSSNKDLIGQINTSAGLLRALNGELVVETGRINNATSTHNAYQPFDWSVGHWFIESYIPIRDRGQVVGVVELYKTPTALSQTIANITLLVWACAALAGLLLFALIVWLLSDRGGGGKPIPQPRSAAAARRPWGAAATMLAVTLLGPVLLGVAVLYVYDSADNPLGALLVNEPASSSATGESLATAPIQLPALNNTTLTTAVIKPAALDEPGVPAALSLSDSDKLSVPAAVEQASPAAFEPQPQQPVAPSDTTVALTSAPATGTSVTEPVPDPVSEQADLLFWQSVADSDDIDLLLSYLVEFPQGRFARIARLQIERLERKTLGELMLRAQRALERRAFVTPTDDNAVLWAKRMLRLDENSRDARAILATVVDNYIDLVQRMRAIGRPALATLYLQRAWSLASYITAEQMNELYALDPRRRPGGQ